MSSEEISEEQRLRKLQQYNLLDTEREEAFDRITRLVTALLNVPIAAVTLVDRDRQWFKSQEGLKVDETPRDQSFCAHAMIGTQPMVINDARLDPRFSDNPLVTGDPDIRFYVGVPLRSADGTPLGALCAIDTKPRQIEVRELAVLNDLANLTMEQLELRLMATLDGLTGAMRRVAFLGLAFRDLALAQRQRTALSCLMLDADHFKKTNDEFGHAVGDEILVRIVAACKGELRRSDIVGRMGGEEFCIFLPGTEMVDAVEVAERLRKAIAEIQVGAGAKTAVITASIGVAERAEDDVTPQDMINRADKALYAAKKAGRNQVRYLRQRGPKVGAYDDRELFSPDLVKGVPRALASKARAAKFAS